MVTPIVVPDGMVLSLQVVDSTKVIKEKILRECAKQVNRKIVNAFPMIKSRAQAATVIFFSKTAIYKSLEDGPLAGHFGLRMFSRDMQLLNLLLELSREIQVRLDPFRVSGGKFIGHLIYEFMYDDFSRILSTPEAKVVIKDGSLPWLQWLLLEGDRIIVSDHEIKFKPGTGRSGMATMVVGDTGTWRVPAWAAGTRTDNWLTRAVKSSSSTYVIELKKIIEEEVKKVL